MNIVRCETGTQLQTNYIERGPLLADSFTYSQFTEIARNCHRVRLPTAVRLEYLSQWFIQRVYPVVPVVMVIRAPGRRAVLLAEEWQG
jgi:hypothetical protein